MVFCFDGLDEVLCGEDCDRAQDHPEEDDESVAVAEGERHPEEVHPDAETAALLDAVLEKGDGDEQQNDDSADEVGIFHLEDFV